MLVSAGLHAVISVLSSRAWYRNSARRANSAFATPADRRVMLVAAETYHADLSVLRSMLGRKNPVKLIAG